MPENRLIELLTRKMAGEASDSELHELDEMLSEHPEYLVKILNEWMPIPSLIGIEVHLIYQPANAKADIPFFRVSEFYGNMLEAKGAKVIVEGNILK